MLFAQCGLSLACRRLPGVQTMYCLKMRNILSRIVISVESATEQTFVAFRIFTLANLVPIKVGEKNDGKL